MSFNLEERLLDFAVTEVYDQYAERWEVHYPHRPFSENMFRLTTDRVGQRLEIASQPLVHQEFLRPTTGRRDLLYVFRWEGARSTAQFRQDDPGGEACCRSALRVQGGLNNKLSVN